MRCTTLVDNSSTIGSSWTGLAGRRARVGALYDLLITDTGPGTARTHRRNRWYRDLCYGVRISNAGKSRSRLLSPDDFMGLKNAIFGENGEVPFLGFFERRLFFF